MRILSSFLLFIIFVIPSRSIAQDKADLVMELTELLNGRFIISERPDDFKVNFVWVNELFSHPKLGENLLYHKRVLSHAPDKPLVQLIMQVIPVKDKVAIQYYAFRKAAENELNEQENPIEWLKQMNPEKVALLEEQTIILDYKEGVFYGKAEYPTIFRGSDFGKIEMRIQKGSIYNWTRYFKKDGTLVYGPKEEGYYLKKSS